MMPVADKPDGMAVMDRSPAAGPPERVASVDAFRGVVILLMIFVNDVAGVNPLLAYILHPMLFLIAGIAGIRIGFYKSPELPVFVNILGCLMMAFFVVGLTGLVTRLGYRMKA